MQLSATKNSLGRSEWLLEAIQVLGEQGIESVRVEPIAKRLGVTKGSFYHHFADRDDLLTSVLDRWHQQATLLVIEIVNQFSRRPEDRIRHLLGLVVDPNSRETFRLVDVGIRDWARRDRRALSMLESIDRERIAYIAGRLTALGCEASDAELRGFLIYSYILGEAQIERNDPHEVRAERVERCMERLVLDLPGVGSVEEA